MMVNTGDLCGNADIAAMAGVTHGAAGNWRLRYDTFPSPVVVISGSIPIYSRQAVAEWLVATGRVTA